MAPVYQRGVTKGSTLAPSRAAAGAGDAHLDGVDDRAGDIAIRWHTRSASSRTCVAQAGSDDLDDQPAPVEAHRLDVRATASPTISSQRPNTPPIACAAPGPPGVPPCSERTTPSSEAANGTGSVAPPSHRSSTALLPPPHRWRTVTAGTTLPASMRMTRSGSAAAGIAPAVVITTWPAGSDRSRAAGPMGVELGQHVVEHEHRRRPGALGDEPVGTEAQRQRQRALLALGGVGAGRHAVDASARARHGAGPTVDTPRRTSSARAAASAAARPSRRHGGS